MSDAATTATAGAAIASPLWLPKLHAISALAAEVLPILGAVWLLTQIVTKVIETRRKARGNP